MSSIFRSRREEDSTKPTRYFSDLQEKSVAKAVGGKQSSNSGSTMWWKGDVYSDNILYECKTCTKEKKSFTIQEDWLIKNKQESLFMDKDYSVLVFNFGPNKPNYYIMDENTFKEFLDYIRGD